MRYHKASAISSPEATGILDSAWLSLNPYPVVKLFDKWFDIRRMTASEVQYFTDDFMRATAGDSRSVADDGLQGAPALA